VFAANLLRYQLLSRTKAGRTVLERWGERSRRKILRRYFGDQDPDVGRLAL
jgi:hypothetical protein